MSALARLRFFGLPVVVCVFQVVGVLGAWKGAQWRGDTVGVTPPDALAFALLAAGPLALFGRRRWPVPVLAVTGAAVGAYLLLGYVHGPVFLAPVVAFFGAVLRGHRTAAAVTGLAGLAGYTVLAALPGGVPTPTLVGIAVQLGWWVALVSVGELVLVRRERRAEAERVRREEERRRVGEERLRIARELHDVLAHNISMINVQAGVALHLMDDDPEQARTALTAIKEASKDALTEVRSVLGVLRRVDEAAPRAPTAGLAALDGLITRARAAGLRVHRRLTGTPRTLPSGVDLAAFRIAQEALTNVARHAEAGNATIHLEYGDDHVTVRVDDDGVGPNAAAETPGTGSGITGMRERAAALGGELYAGPGPGGGFRVRARLPVPPAADREDAEAAEAPGAAGGGAGAGTGGDAARADSAGDSAGAGENDEDAEDGGQRETKER